MKRRKMPFHEGIGIQTGGLRMALRLRRPAGLAQRHLLASLLAASVYLALPRVVLAETGLSVTGVIEIDLGDLRLDECPNTPRRYD